jgi:hypothetical protein
MAENRYRVVFSGEIAEGRDETDVHRNLAALFRITDDRAALLFSGAPVILKKDIDKKTADRYRETIARAGAIVHVEEMSVAPDGAKPAQEPPSAGIFKDSTPYNILSPAPGFASLLFEPLTIPTLSPASNGLSFGRQNMATVRYENIVFTGVYLDEQKSGEYSLVLFLRGERRPYNASGTVIRYRDFPGISAETVKSGLKLFVARLLEQNHLIWTDMVTVGYLNGQSPFLPRETPLMYLTALGRALAEKGLIPPEPQVRFSRPAPPEEPEQ